MSLIQAVVFDMDGILIDSEVLWRQVREEFAADNGMVWNALDQESTMGCNTRMWSRIMVERLQLQERLGMDDAAIAKEIKARLLAKYEAHLPEREGAVASVLRVAQKYKVALASGSPNELATHVMKVTGLDQVFLATMYGDDVTHGKPAPDIYLEVLKKIGVAPEQAVGIEDSGNGIRSLRAARMGIVAAPGPEFPLSEEVLALADVRIEHMAEVNPELIEQAAAQRRLRG
ncbi:HAD family hydrolase [Sphaerotilus microaerophilus]|uniref:Haloacid dehalogenase n=1 Tax=Sphaerotilus microaerophilus TaxID=2914710 RepID=A0ABN6PVH9_9BURK|nr:HAD family phosphatase [Sphaerotilus sp. FB-5]BDI08083.1 haloacid dehalogenase [Sphaerotilus sp. FB-5]